MIKSKLLNAKNLTNKQRIEIFEQVIVFIEQNFHQKSSKYETALYVLKYMLKLEKRIIGFLHNKPTNDKMLITLEVIHECGEIDIKDSKTKLYFELAYNCVKTLYEQNKAI